MDKEAVQKQLIRTGLITKARLSSQTPETVRQLNEWAELCEVDIRFHMEGKHIGWPNQRGRK